MEDVLIATLAAWAKSHPALAAVIAAVILVWWVLSQGWKALPKERRDHWTTSHPRMVGVLRLALELGPDLVGAARVAIYQVILGRPARPANGLEDAGGPGTVRGELRETSAPPGPVEAIQLSPGAEPYRRANPDDSGPRASGGYAEAAVLRWVAAVSVAALGVVWLAGCPIPPPDGCPPRATRCNARGVPQVCTLGQYWSAPRPETPCPTGSVCCYTRSPYGRALHACVPQSACLPEPSPPDDAGTEGGAL